MVVILLKTIKVVCLLLSILGITLGCSGHKLNYSIVQSFRVSYSGSNSVILVVSDRESLLPQWIEQTDKEQIIDSIDFSKYLLVFIVRGSLPTSEEFNVTSIKEKDNSIDIVATFLWQPGPAIATQLGSPAQAIRINKTNLHNYGQKMFRLLDTNYTEKASITIFITEP
jgi:hypothetical protein